MVSSDTAYLIDLETDGNGKPDCCLKRGVLDDRIIGFGRATPPQQVRDTPMHGRQVRLQFHLCRYRFQVCGGTFFEAPSWLDDRRRATRRLVEAVRRDALLYPNLVVARTYGIDDKTVKNILDDHVRELELTTQFETPTFMGIDEIHIVGKPRAFQSPMWNAVPWWGCCRTGTSRP